MAYATPEELAVAVRVNVTEANRALLEYCVEASTTEIDHYCNRDLGSPIPPDDALAHMVCIARGVEWWKVNDSAFGALGFDQTGVLTAPADTFARHGRSLIPHKQRFGVA